MLTLQLQSSFVQAPGYLEARKAGNAECNQWVSTYGLERGEKEAAEENRKMDQGSSGSDANDIPGAGSGSE